MTRIFTIGPVPVAVNILPVAEAFADASFDLEGVLEAFSETENTYTSEIGFSLESGWTSNESKTSTDKADVTLTAKGTAKLFGGVRFKLGILVYFTAYVAPFLAFGPFAEIEATSNPLAVLNDDLPPFHFSKFDLGAKTSIGIEAEFQKDIPFIDETEFKFKSSLEFPDQLLSLPGADFVLSDFEQCSGENALQMTVRIEETGYTLPTENQIEGPYKFVEDFEPDDWEITQNDRHATFTLKRSVIENREFYALPNPSQLYFRSHARIPPTPFFALLFNQDLNTLAGVPTISDFECCDETDCVTKYGEPDESGETYVCKDNLCESDEPSSAPTAAPTTSPTPSPTEEEEEEDDDRDDGGAHGDPHLFTFDGLSYSCQGAGDFILTKSLDSPMEVQTRFKKKGLYVTLATAVVAKSSAEGSPVVDIAISDEDGCPINILLDGSPVEMTSTPSGMVYSDDEVRIDVSGRAHNIIFKEDGLKIFNDLLLPSSFPHWRTRVSLPSAFRNERIVGLLGSNNDDALDDWTDPTGAVLPIPTTGRTGSDAFNFCTTHWCIRNETDSLFNYTKQFPFEYHSFCDEPYIGDIDLSQITQQIRDLCGLDVSCIIDGIELGIEGSQNVLEAQSLLVRAGRSSRF